MTDMVKGPDGRSARWDGHRQERRADLVEAAVAAVEEIGPDASVADVARAAGVSKPVLYRYFDDKQELQDEVVRWAAAQVLAGIRPALADAGSIRDRIAVAVDSYLQLLATHPNVFRLVLRHRTDAGTALPPGSAEISASFARVIGDAMRSLGLDAGGAEPWATGLVGLGLSTGEWWLERGTMSRAAAGRYLADFIWHAFAGIAGEQGVALDALAVATRPDVVTPLHQEQR